MIHSKATEPDQIASFCAAYRQLSDRVPLVAIPTTYCRITESELTELGVRLVIYANHLLRSAYPAMVRTAETILNHQRAMEAETLCMPIADILTLLPGSPQADES